MSKRHRNDRIPHLLCSATNSRAMVPSSIAEATQTPYEVVDDVVRFHAAHSPVRELYLERLPATDVQGLITHPARQYSWHTAGPGGG